MNRELPSPELLRKLLRYDQATGFLYWNARPESMFSSARDCAAWNTRYAGNRAFASKNDKGYCTGSIANRNYSAHRVIWAMETGVWPDRLVDHKDKDRSNNKLDNLRLATYQQNKANSTSARGSSSKFIGVSWNKFSKKWSASIKLDGKSKHIGYFDSEVEAAEAYDNEASIACGEYAATNFRKNS